MVRNKNALAMITRWLLCGILVGAPAGYPILHGSPMKEGDHTRTDMSTTGELAPVEKRVTPSDSVDTSQQKNWKSLQRHHLYRPIPNPPPDPK